MKKKLLLAGVLIGSLLVQPLPGEAASKVDKINKELAQLREQMEEAKSTQEKAKKDSEAVKTKKAETTSSLHDVLEQIDTYGQQMNAVKAQLKDTTTQLESAARELDTAEARIESSDELLQSRIRLSYTNGLVSYLDVLLNATSFSDFLGRMDSLHAIMNQNKDILEQQKRDKTLVIEKKHEVETTLADVKVMYSKLGDYNKKLAAKEQEKQTLIATYDAKLEELEEVSEEQSDLVMELAKKESELLSKRTAEEIAIKKREAALKAKKEAEQNSKNNRSDHSSSSQSYKGGRLALPLHTSYYISSPFGYRIHPIFGTRKLHAGEDMAAPEGTPIYAAEAGNVLIAQWSGGYGNMVIIDHGSGLWTVYGHIRNGGIKVEKGDYVERGQKIAEVGSTGNSTGNHLHFEVRKDGVAVDPAPYLK